MLRGFEFLGHFRSIVTKGFPAWHRNFPLRSSPAHFFGLYGVLSFGIVQHSIYELIIVNKIDFVTRRVTWIGRSHPSLRTVSGYFFMSVPI